jgi:hypothetical protein
VENRTKNRDEPALEYLLYFRPSVVPLFGSLEVISDDLLEVNIYYVTGGHHVVEVHALHERLNLATLLNFSLTHGLSDLPRVPLDAGDCERMGSQETAYETQI